MPEGDLDDEVAVSYHRADQLVGGGLIGLASRYQHYSSLIAAE